MGQDNRIEKLEAQIEILKAQLKEHNHILT